MKGHGRKGQNGNHGLITIDHLPLAAHGSVIETVPALLLQGG
jgi:hypothetical protein